MTARMFSHHVHSLVQMPVSVCCHTLGADDDCALGCLPQVKQLAYKLAAASRHGSVAMSSAPSSPRHSVLDVPLSTVGSTVGDLSMALTAGERIRQNPLSCVMIELLT
jgi:hypothetical protein